MRSKAYLLIVGLALVLGPTLANSQQGAQPGGFGGAGGFGGGGFGGGGRGGFSRDPNQMFDNWAKGKDVLTKTDVPVFMQGMFDNWAQSAGSTNGQITRAQFTQVMSQFTGGMGARQPGGTGAGAMAQGTTPGGANVPGAGAGFGNFGGNRGGFGGQGATNPFAGFGGNRGGFGGQGAGFGFGGQGAGFGIGGQGAGFGFGGQGGNQFAGFGRGQGGQGGGMAFDPNTIAEMRFRRMDADGDGLLNYDEMDDTLKAERQKWDTNGDGFIDLNEFKAYFTARIQQFQQQNGFTSIAPDGTIPEEKPVVFRAGKLPPNLPAWFSQYDTDRDGQIGLYEWKSAGQSVDQFVAMDRNGDGFLTVEEVLRATGATTPGTPTAGTNVATNTGAQAGFGGFGNGNNPFGGFGNGNNPFGGFGRGQGGFGGFGNGNNPFGGFGRGQGGFGGQGGGNNPFGGQGGGNRRGFGNNGGTDTTNPAGNQGGGGGRRNRGGFGGGFGGANQ